MHFVLIVILAGILTLVKPVDVLSQESRLFSRDTENPVKEGSLPEDARFLGEVEENGILGMAWLSRNQPATAGSSPGYTLYVRFLSTASNLSVEKGLVAYKLEDRSGKKSPARKMEFEQGYFIAVLEAPTERAGSLLIGSKLEDDRKRQFRYAVSFR